jgi:hypothetical protein
MNDTAIFSNWKHETLQQTAQRFSVQTLKISIRERGNDWQSMRDAQKVETSQIRGEGEWKRSNLAQNTSRSC